MISTWPRAGIIDRAIGVPELRYIRQGRTLAGSMDVLIPIKTATRIAKVYEGATVKAPERRIRSRILAASLQAAVEGDERVSAKVRLAVRLTSNTSLAGELLTDASSALAADFRSRQRPNFQLTTWTPTPSKSSSLECWLTLRSFSSIFKNGPLAYDPSTLTSAAFDRSHTWAFSPCSGPK
jgi:hypothetical protein